MLSSILQKIFQGNSVSWSLEQIKDMISSGQLDKAERAIQKLSQLTPDRNAYQKALTGHIDFLRGYDEKAEAAFRNALSESPAHAYSHFGLSLVLTEKGDREQALEHAQFAVNIDGNDGRMLAQLGFCYMQVDAYSTAEGFLKRAAKLQPHDKYTWNNLAIISRMKGDLAEAKACWLQALSIDPSFQKAADNMQQLDAELSNAHMTVTIQAQSKAAQLSKYETQFSGTQLPRQKLFAILSDGCLDQAINLAETEWPDQPNSEDYSLLSSLYREANDAPSSLHLIQSWVTGEPGNPLAHEALGVEFLLDHQPGLAIHPLEKAVELGCTGASVHTHLGNALFGVERYSEAVVHLNDACKLEWTPSNRKRLASAMLMCCRYPEAIDIYQALITEKSVDFNEIKGNYAACLAYMGEFDQATTLLNEIILSQPHDPPIRLMRAMIHLLNERWQEGWIDYRWRGTSQTKQLRTLPFPKWNGEPLQGKTIILLAEQGLGDQIMFASCIPDLIKLKPSRLIIEASQRVAVTLARTFSEHAVIASKQNNELNWLKELGNIDYFLPLGDLPGFFRNQEHQFPGLPYLVADEQKVSHWQSWLKSLGPPPYIGFSWRGGTELTRTAVRTTDSSLFAQAMKVVGGTWVCLQYGEVQSALQTFSMNGQAVGYDPAAIDNLDDFAALIQCLDHVLTVCNTTVHFAGALGVPTSVLAPRIPEWRYGLRFRHMPWYQSVVIYRQSEPNNWASVLNEAIQGLNLPKVAKSCL